MTVPVRLCPANGKKCFVSPEDAERRRKELKRNRGGDKATLQVYRCNRCKCWHLGHSR